MEGYHDQKNIVIALLLVLVAVTIYLNIMIINGNDAQASGGIDPEVPSWMSLSAELMTLNGAAVVIGCLLGSLLQKRKTKK